MKDIVCDNTCMNNMKTIGKKVISNDSGKIITDYPYS